MKIFNFLKKFNKTYSIVVIPNSNTPIKKYSIKSPFTKVIYLLVLVLLLVSSLFVIKSILNEKYGVKSVEASNEILQQQVQNLFKHITEQDKALAVSYKELEQLKANVTAKNVKISEFIELYNQITNNYISKSNRGTSAKNYGRAGLQLLNLSDIIEDLDRNRTNSIFTPSLQKTKEKLGNFVNAMPTLVPANGEICSRFGMRNHPIQKVYKIHEGVDITSSTGDPIFACASGVVEYSGESEGYGFYVIIDHKNGYRTIYAHSSKLLVEKGDSVTKGQKIALVGSTGLSTGPHLHFEIRIGNTPVDPIKYIDFGSTN